MATLTSTAMAHPAREAIPGVNSVTVKYDSGTTEIEASATTILMCKVPNHSKVLDIIQYHTTGAATCPVDFGVDDDLDALATAATQGAVSRATAGVPFQVSLTDGAANQYSVVKATATPGTATAGVKIDLSVLYQPNSKAEDL